MIDDGEHRFRCTRCGDGSGSERRLRACPDCGGRLEVELSLPDALPGDGTETDLWRYADFLPTTGVDPPSMGEGWTPLVDAPALVTATEEVAGEPAPEVLLKNETVNPTWSWKGRFAGLLVAHAVAAGHDRVATATSGNHGSAIAAYASRAGVERVLAMVSPSSEPAHHRQMRAYGAESIALEDYGERRVLLRELADRGWFVAYDLAERYTGQPYVYEGYKTIAYEIVEQLGDVPDAVVVPVGSGAGFYGVWKGFRELAAAEIVDRTPAMIGAESAERHPLTKAYESDVETVGTDEGPQPISASTASTTAIDPALRAVRDSGGSAHAVEREGVERAVRTVGRDGVFLEPASALAPGALAAARSAGTIDAADTVVAVGTGAGIAWPETTAGVVGRPPTVEPTLAAIGDAVDFEL